MPRKSSLESRQVIIRCCNTNFVNLIHTALFVVRCSVLQAKLNLTMDLFLSTNDCRDPKVPESAQWDHDLLAMFGGWLTPSRLNLDSCASPPSTHCNLLRVLDLLYAHGGSRVYASVVMARPDVYVNPDGELLLVDLVNQSRTGFVWPHMCEPSSWALFQCVSDLFFGMPSHYLPGFNQACLGRAGCYSMAYQDKAGWGHVMKPYGAAFDVQSLESVGGKGVSKSGHACLRCVTNLQKNDTVFWQPRTATRYPGQQFAKAQSFVCHSEPRLGDPDACAKACADFPNRRCRAWTTRAPTGCTCELYPFAVAPASAASSDTVRGSFLHIVCFLRASEVLKFLFLCVYWTLKGVWACRP